MSRACLLNFAAVSWHTETTKWVRFACHLADGDHEDTRLTLSGYAGGWERFVNCDDYDASYDPVAKECFLVVDEVEGGLGPSYVARVQPPAELLSSAHSCPGAAVGWKGAQLE